MLTTEQFLLEVSIQFLLQNGVYHSGIKVSNCLPTGI